MFFDKQGKRISPKQYVELMALGEEYSLIDEVVFKDDLEIPLTRLRIQWIGESPNNIPPEYATPFRIVMHNNVGGKWVVEPRTARLSEFHLLESAKIAFDKEVETLSVRFKTAEVKSGLSKGEVDDLDDYGEPPVIKDKPKTKSPKLGAW